MHKRYPGFVLLLLATAILVNTANVSAEQLRGPTPVKQVMPKPQPRATSQSNAEQLTINQLQSEIRAIKAAVQSYQATHFALNQSFSANGKLNDGQALQLKLKAQNLLAKAQILGKNWSLSRQKFPMAKLSQAGQLRLVDLKQDLRAIAHARGMDECLFCDTVTGSGSTSAANLLNPVAQPPPMSACLDQINDSSTCQADCCDAQACTNCCVNSQPPEKVSICSARCLYKAALCIMAGVAERQAENTQTITTF